MNNRDNYMKRLTEQLQIFAGVAIEMVNYDTATNGESQLGIHIRGAHEGLCEEIEKAWREEMDVHHDT